MRSRCYFHMTINVYQLFRRVRNRLHLRMLNPSNCTAPEYICKGLGGRVGFPAFLAAYFLHDLARSQGVGEAE